jgi:hypothetical protein
MKLVRPMQLLILTLLCLGVVAAQQTSHKDAKKTSSKSETSMGMPMPKPSTQIEKLAEKIVGTWNTSEDFEVSEMMPKGGKGHGTAVIKKGPGGLSVTEDYHSRGGMGAFAGHGVFWWDEKANGFKSVWCDNTSPAGCSVSNGLGKWEGNDVVFNDEQEMMGKKMAMKEVYTELKPSSFTMTMDGSQDGGPMKRQMTIKYTKAGAKATKTTASAQ